MEPFWAIYQWADDRGLVGSALIVGLYLVAFAALYALSPHLKRMGTLVGGVLGTLILLGPLAVLVGWAFYVGDPPPKCSGALTPDATGDLRMVMGPPDYCEPRPAWFPPEKEIAEWEACRKSSDTCIPSAAWNVRIEKLKAAKK